MLRISSQTHAQERASPLMSPNKTAARLSPASFAGLSVPPALNLDEFSLELEHSALGLDTPENSPDLAPAKALLR